jgi:hypothetical protein
LYILSQEISNMSASNKPSTNSKLRKYLNYNYSKSIHLHSHITINNTTSFEITIQVTNFPSITIQNFKQHQQKLNFQQLVEIFMD